ncbi:chondroitin sulfate N-acetylgalactosaminyltransferase 1-like [Oratosquilla oratoria]|uniref:chondroitin sulfate N-acetylgalactosaminyltransferase 1-like n=1 Tax=Oratosquilla oratoria TaxID=337810 RepID=UPI003F777BDE
MIYNHHYYEFFNGHTVFSGKPTTIGTNSRRPLINELPMFRKVQEVAAMLVNKNQDSRVYYKENCTSIKYRLVPLVGFEYQVTCHGKENGLERVTVVQPLGSPIATHHISVPPELALNIIMPLKGRVNSLKVFLTQLRNQKLKDPLLHVGLTLVYFDDNSTEEVRGLLEDPRISLSGLKTELILLQGEEARNFSRGRGLQVGLERSQSQAEVVFFCDVDVYITLDFLHRCRSTPLRGLQIFVPTVFNQYNPLHIYGKNLGPGEVFVQDLTGTWRIFGYGMVCGYKEDLEVHGFDKSLEMWGGEDVNYVKKFANERKLKIIRSLDPGLIHLYHGKNCTGLTGSHKSNCFTTKYAAEGHSKIMSRKYFESQNKINQLLKPPEEH